MENFFKLNGLCSENDRIEMRKAPLSPTNLYDNYSVLINGEYQYFYKKLSALSDESFFEFDLAANLELSNLNIAPKVIHFDRNQKFIITKFIHHEKNSFLNKLDLIARQIKLFHAKCNSFDNRIYNQKRDFWFRKYAELPIKIKEDFRCAFEIIANQKNFYEDQDEVISHNDFHQSNILLDSDSVYIIDFDHIGKNTKYFDLATLAISLELNGEIERFFLECYSPNYEYQKFSIQKVVCAAQYAIATVALVYDFKNINQQPITGDQPFSWKCNDPAEMEFSRLKSAYNFLNYFKKIQFDAVKS